MKKTLALAVALLCLFNLNASHIIGGFISYTYASGTTYNITLNLYRDCTSSTYFDEPAYIGVYDASTHAYIEEILTSNLAVSNVLPSSNTCLQVTNSVCNQLGVYTFQVTLPSSTEGYVIAYQRCCRNATITNITDPSGTGETIYTYIPPTATYANNSPVFKNYPPIYICVDAALSFDHSAVDPDGDVLRYSLTTPTGGATSLNPEPTPAGAPPYPLVTWQPPYSLTNVMGGTPLAIDSITGVLTGKPNQIGQYVVGVGVSEYRNGQLINTYARDFQFNVVECSYPIAKIPSTDINPGTGIGLFTLDCKNHTINFQNSSYYPVGNSPLNYFWNFGVPGITTDTSTAQYPTFTYPDTGTFEVQLIAVKGDSSSQCTDTTHAFVKVYPTFIANFDAQDTCAGGPVIFTDSTYTTLGSISQWSWNFGDNSSSTLQNPTHSYSSAGTYNVTEIAGSTLGCLDTAQKTVVTYYTSVNTISNSLPVCVGSPVNFTSNTENNYRWNFGSGATSSQQNPPFSFSSSGNHTVNLIAQTAKGCFDSVARVVNVHPVPVVTVSNNATICGGDSAQLFATGGGTYSWTPATGLSAPDSSHTTATPVSASTTVYKVLVTDTNHCVTTDSVTVSFFSAATVHAGPDTLLCLAVLTGNDTIQLNASGGTSYRWSPASGLSSTNIPNPMAVITSSGTFKFPVAIVDQNNCNYVDTATISIYPVPAVTISADKNSFCSNDSANICSTTGFASYQWNAGGSGICTVAKSTGSYFVVITDNNGCKNKSNEISVSVLPAPVDSITSDKKIFCPDDSARVCALAGFTSYQWNTGETGSCIEATEAGDYYVTVTNSNGCSAESNHLPINTYPIPSVAIIVEGNRLSSFGQVDYQWYLDGSPIKNSTGDTCLAQTAGEYSVAVTDSNGCSIISNPVKITATGIATLGEDRVALYPNPSVSSWQLAVGNELVGSALEVYDDNGRLVWKEELQSTKYEITTALPVGVYWLRISNDKVSVVKKMVKM